MRRLKRHLTKTGHCTLMQEPALAACQKLKHPRFRAASLQGQEDVRHAEEGQPEGQGAVPASGFLDLAQLLATTSCARCGQWPARPGMLLAAFSILTMRNGNEWS